MILDKILFLYTETYHFLPLVLLSPVTPSSVKELSITKRDLAPLYGMFRWRILLDLFLNISGAFSRRSYRTKLL